MCERAAKDKSISCLTHDKEKLQKKKKKQQGNAKSTHIICISTDLSRRFSYPVGGKLFLSFITYLCLFNVWGKIDKVFHCMQNRLRETEKQESIVFFDWFEVEGGGKAKN